MLDAFDEDFEEPSRYFTSAEEAVGTDSAKKGLRRALSKHANKNAEIRQLCGQLDCGCCFCCVVAVVAVVIVVVVVAAVVIVVISGRVVVP